MRRLCEFTVDAIEQLWALAVGTKMFLLETKVGTTLLLVTLLGIMLWAILTTGD